MSMWFSFQQISARNLQAGAPHRYDCRVVSPFPGVGACPASGAYSASPGHTLRDRLYRPQHALSSVVDVHVLFSLPLNSDTFVLVQYFLLQFFFSGVCFYQFYYFP